MNDFHINIHIRVVDDILSRILHDQCLPPTSSATSSIQIEALIVEMDLWSTDFWKVKSKQRYLIVFFRVIWDINKNLNFQ